MTAPLLIFPAEQVPRGAPSPLLWRVTCSFCSAPQRFFPFLAVQCLVSVTALVHKFFHRIAGFIGPRDEAGRRRLRRRNASNASGAAERPRRLSRVLCRTVHSFLCCRSSGYLTVDVLTVLCSGRNLQLCRIAPRPPQTRQPPPPRLHQRRRHRPLRRCSHLATPPYDAIIFFVLLLSLSAFVPNRRLLPCFRSVVSRPLPSATKVRTR
jgi:hypothetical protein